MDCIGCNACNTASRCVFAENAVNEFIEITKESDGFIFGAPIYYAHASGRIQSFLDRVFYANPNAFMFKPGAIIVSEGMD